jgi:hypothetical protein
MDLLDLTPLSTSPSPRQILGEFNKIGLLGLNKIVLKRSSQEICQLLKICSGPSHQEILCPFSPTRPSSHFSVGQFLQILRTIPFFCTARTEKIAPA